MTGTRAEFGLMLTTLASIRRQPALELQIVATGMHLDPRHGDALGAIRREGFRLNAVVRWPASSGRSPSTNAINTGSAIAALAATFRRLRSDIVLVVGDRVEAFAAAAAAHLSHVLVAHVHGGDRALGQIDDSLRHAITKLAHVHFAATRESARRIHRLGEAESRIFCVGSPGNDCIRELAAPRQQIAALFPRVAPSRFALVLLHPAGANARLERRRAELVLRVLKASPIPHLVVLYPNNDPGCSGIIQAWRRAAGDPSLTILRDLPRGVFLGLMRDAAMLVGNSSAGIIEAASFRVAAIDIGPRQAGRQRPPNVFHCDYDQRAISRLIARVWNRGRPLRPAAGCVYSSNGAGRRIASVLSRLRSRKLAEKLIIY